MTGQILDLSSSPLPDVRSVFDVVVVGSGSGGATAARRLAEAGRQVLVVEEGGDFTGKALNQRESEMFDQLYMDRGGRATEDQAITVLQGRVLGGGGTINAADVVPIPDPVLRHWQRKWGLGEFSPEQLAPWRDEILRVLSANPPNEGQINPGNRKVLEGAKRLNWRAEVMLHNRVGCRGLGNCLIGCPFNAKRNPRMVAIPAALAAGATFWTRARVLRIEGVSGEIKSLHLKVLDPKGYREGAGVTLRARVVIVAANAINSAQLLLRSGVDHPLLGRHLSLQPQLPVVAVFPEELRSFRGIPQSAAVTEFETITEEDGLGGFRLEGIMGTPGMSSMMLPRSGHPGKSLMTLYPRLAAVLCLVPDKGEGRVELLPSGRPRIHFHLSEGVQTNIRKAAAAATRLFLEAGAQKVIIPTVPAVEITTSAEITSLGQLPLRTASTPLISAHQQGTVRMAPNRSDGAADPTGLVYGTRDVYVFDSSGFPTSSSSHTMTPIMTVSAFLTDQLLTRMKT